MSKKSKIKGRENKLEVRRIQFGKYFQRNFRKQILDAFPNSYDLESLALKIASEKNIQPNMANDSMPYAIYGYRGKLHENYKGII